MNINQRIIQELVKNVMKDIIVKKELTLALFVKQGLIQYQSEQTVKTAKLECSPMQVRAVVLNVTKDVTVKKASSCIQCSGGTYLNADRTKCEDCKAGTYSNPG
jgi:DnaJ-class molecular chaperone